MKVGLNWKEKIEKLNPITGAGQSFSDELGAENSAGQLGFEGYLENK